MTAYIEEIIQKSVKPVKGSFRPQPSRTSAEVIQNLVDLFRHPSEKAAHAHTQQLPMKVEFFLLQALLFCHEYLWEANAYTDTQHNDFRAAIVSG